MFARARRKKAGPLALAEVVTLSPSDVLIIRLAMFDLAALNGVTKRLADALGPELAARTLILGPNDAVRVLRPGYAAAFLQRATAPNWRARRSAAAARRRMENDLGEMAARLVGPSR